MLPLLIEAADQMEAIYWQTAYGDKEQLFEGITDSALIKYLSINYGPWDRARRQPALSRNCRS